LQWATYEDASDQTSLSRIWGGIHPPADDIPGRLIGKQIGIDAFKLAESYFKGNTITALSDLENPQQALNVYPNPVTENGILMVSIDKLIRRVELNLTDLQGRRVYSQQFQISGTNAAFELNLKNIPNGVYLLKAAGDSWEEVRKVVVLK